jgi:hypothetical protein
MGYLGYKPADKPLTAADITDSIITSAKIVDGTIATADLNTGLTVNLGAGAVGTPTLTTSGDTNTGIFFPTADTIAFTEGGAEAMRIDPTGNVLVGTTSDAGYKLAIISSSTATPPLAIRSTAGSDAGTAMIRIMKATSTNTSSQIFIQFVIDGNNVNSGQINANGASQAAFGSFSDVRLKKNIENLSNQLNNILNLRPVEFDFKDDSGHQIGFIAQEMEQVYPDAVGVGQDEMLTITGWSKTEARLVKAIQEQQAIIEQLKVRLTALENI